jgi:hypothetical protein
MDDYDYLSIHEIRRRAPLHYWAKADNARFAAYCLWRLRDRGKNKAAAKEAKYGGAPTIALAESFQREASIALELIIKAVIAQRIECGVANLTTQIVRPTHDLRRLWEDAALPALSNEDQHRLLIARRILLWAGRYAAPKKDDQYDREEAEMEPLQQTVPLGTLKIIKHRTFDWEDVDRIYQLPHTSFWTIRHENGIP